MPKKRVIISTTLQRQLFTECSGVCCVPDCMVTVDLHIHHIDSNPSNTKLANLILLCPNHHAAADRGEISKSQCVEYKKRRLNLRRAVPVLMRVIEDLLQHRDSEAGSSTSQGLGFTAQWGSPGPRIEGSGVVISPSESVALLDRWTVYLPKFIELEKDASPESFFGSLERGQLLAALRACGDTYNRVPDEDQMRKQESELARKYDLFYRFSRELLYDSLEAEKHDKNKRA